MGNPLKSCHNIYYINNIWGKKNHSSKAGRKRDWLIGIISKYAWYWHLAFGLPSGSSLGLPVSTILDLWYKLVVAYEVVPVMYMRVNIAEINWAKAVSDD